MSTISLLNSKGEFKSMEPFHEFCCLHQILCIACMYFVHIKHSFEELYVIWLVEDGRMMSLNEKYHHSCCPLYGSLNSQHPNSQTKLWQFKCSRPLSQWRTIVPSRATEETVVYGEHLEQHVIGVASGTMGMKPTCSTPGSLKYFECSSLKMALFL